MTSKLDPGQIIQEAFDEEEKRFRVDAQVTANISGAQEVVISHTDDSIKVGDGVEFLAIDADGSAQVRVTSSALPTGASTEATLSGLNTKVVTTANGIKVDGSAVTQPISGTVAISGTVPVSGSITANAGTNLNTSALALDATVAKDASLTTLNTSVNSLLKPASTLTAVTSITNAVTIKADTAVNQTNALKVDGSATTQPVSAAALPLPTGASTSALQTTSNTNTASIDTRLANGISVVRPSSYTTGNITSGTPGVAGNTVNYTASEGQLSWSVQVSGTFSAGTELYFEGSQDNSIWFNLNGRRNSDATTNDTTTTLAANFIGGPGPVGGNPSHWRGNLAAIRYFRVRAHTYAPGDNVLVQITTSSALGATFQNAALPTGSNIIGDVGTKPMAAWQTGSVAVSTAAVQVASSAIASRVSITVKSVTGSSQVIYVGNSSAVNSTTGFPLSNGEGLDIDLAPGASIWAIASGSNSSNRIHWAEGSR